MKELRLSCKVSPKDKLAVSKDVVGEIAFETTDDSVVILTIDDVRKLIAWLQERLDT